MKDVIEWLKWLFTKQEYPRLDVDDIVIEDSFPKAKSLLKAYHQAIKQNMKVELIEKMELTEQEDRFQKEILIVKGFKYYARKCGSLQSDLDEQLYINTKQSSKLFAIELWKKKYKPLIKILKEKGVEYVVDRIDRQKEALSSLAEAIEKRNKKITVLKESLDKLNTIEEEEEYKKRINQLQQAIQTRNNTIKDLRENIENDIEIKRLRLFVTKSKSFLSKDQFLEIWNDVEEELNKEFGE